MRATFYTYTIYKCINNKYLEYVNIYVCTYNIYYKSGGPKNDFLPLFLEPNSSNN